LLSGAGGLLAYTADPFAPWEPGGRVRRQDPAGANPADFPVEQPTTYQFAVNTQDAQAFGLSIPPSIAGQVTEPVQ